MSKAPPSGRWDYDPLIGYEEIRVELAHLITEERAGWEARQKNRDANARASIYERRRHDRRVDIIRAAVALVDLAEQHGLIEGDMKPRSVWPSRHD